MGYGGDCRRHPKSRSARTLVFGVGLCCLLTLPGCGDDPGQGAEAASGGAPFREEVIDPEGPNAPWGKAVGDINGDGLIDIVIGGHRPRYLTLFERGLRKLGFEPGKDRVGELVWYENPGWQRHLVSEHFSIRTEMEVADLNADGRNDIVAVTDQGLVWLENGDWTPHLVDPAKFHDVEVADLDGDGQPELVVRNQSLFGYANGNFVRVFQRDGDGAWQSRDLPVPHGEGLVVVDMNNDRAPDIVVNGVWLASPGADVLHQPWLPIHYTLGAGGEPLWQWDDTFISTADLNQDGYRDILLSPAEEAGEHYDIAWLINPGPSGDGWRKQVVAQGVESVHHFVAAADADGDGDMDVLTAEMNQGEGDNPVSVYWNEPGGWREDILSHDAGHSLRAVDIDGDFDVDLIGTNWEIRNYQEAYPVRIWRNLTSPKEDWARHVIDDDRPGQATSLLARDLDGDGFPDLISGGWWYRNPHRLAAPWPRQPLGAGATDAVVADDVDGDGDVDVIATGWYAYHGHPSLLSRAFDLLSGRPRHPGNHGQRLFLAENLGGGHWRPRLVATSDEGDFTQGAAVLPGGVGWTVLLSWHQEGTGLDALHLDPGRAGAWRVGRFSPHSQSEDLSVADLDRDGRPDVVLGTRWLRNTGDAWHLRAMDEPPGKPDRNEVGDLDGDGWPDVVVGFEAVSRPGDLVWYRNPAGNGAWRRNPIARMTGPMSLGLGDLDGDSDLDVVVGEHNLVSPGHARLVWFENLGAGVAWRGHRIHQGDEHHDGAVLADLDRDGDLDIASIGWGHRRVMVYENPGL